MNVIWRIATQSLPVLVRRQMYDDEETLMTALVRVALMRSRKPSSECGSRRRRANLTLCDDTVATTPSEEEEDDVDEEAEEEEEREREADKARVTAAPCTAEIRQSFLLSDSFILAPAGRATI